MIREARRLARTLTLALTLIALGLGSPGALAGGRAACRAEFGLAVQVTCYAEQTLWRAGPVEVTAGVEWRHPGTLVTPYTALILALRDWWVVLEVGRGVSPFGNGAAWRWALTAGVRWR